MYFPVKFGDALLRTCNNNNNQSSSWSSKMSRGYGIFFLSYDIQASKSLCHLHQLVYLRVVSVYNAKFDCIVRFVFLFLWYVFLFFSLQPLAHAATELSIINVHNTHMRWHWTFVSFSRSLFVDRS